MLLTIEPGLYISADNSAVDKQWRGIGIRIEDDILVTKKGYEILTDAVPKQRDQIEKLMV
jgi:Xaa-Pro aminopeptidase